MKDLDSYIKEMKIKRLTDETWVNWKIIPTYYFSEFEGKSLIFIINLGFHKSLENIKKKCPELLKCWIKNGGGKIKKTLKTRDIRKQVIWGHQYIKNQGKSLYFKHWVEEDIIFINDINDDKAEISQKTLSYINKRLSRA